MNPITAVWPGRPYPRGAIWDGEGVNFALFSEHAEKVELCLFDDEGRRELQRIELREQTDLVWNMHSSTFSACSENSAKLTPSPSQIAPRG